MATHKFALLDEKQVQELIEAGYRYIMTFPDSLGIEDVMKTPASNTKSDFKHGEIIPFKELPDEAPGASQVITLSTGVTEKLSKDNNIYWFKCVYLELSDVMSEMLEPELILLSPDMLEVLQKKGFNFLAIGERIPRHPPTPGHEYGRLGSVEIECFLFEEKPTDFDKYNDIYPIESEELSDKFGYDVDFMINKKYLA